MLKRRCKGEFPPAENQKKGVLLLYGEGGLKKLASGSARRAVVPIGNKKAGFSPKRMTDLKSVTVT